MLGRARGHYLKSSRAHRLFEACVENIASAIKLDTALFAARQASEHHYL